MGLLQFSKKAEKGTELRMTATRKAYDGLYNRKIKRIIDFVVAIPLFILALPIYLLISIAILADDGLPVSYRPIRGGYQNRHSLLISS